MAGGQSVKIFRRFRYRLYPSVEQQEKFDQFAGVCRLVYNLALEQRSVWGRKRPINFASQSREVTQLRAEFDWAKDVFWGCLSQSLRDLDGAFVKFFKGSSSYPRYKKKGENDAFRINGQDIRIAQLNAKWASLRLPKIGWVNFRFTRPVSGRVVSATINRDALGWHVSFASEIGHEAPQPADGAVGIDRGVATTLALSTGEMLRLPTSLARLEVRKRKAQRIASRRVRGSKRRRRAQQRANRLHAQQARIRRDFHHRFALGIAKRFGVAVLEDLKTQSMTASAHGTVAEPGRNVRQKAGLNRAILNASWHQFQRLLTYKMEERGGRVITVPAAYSSQTCSACGVIDAKSRKNQAVFECVSCGHRDHADTNAAIEILRRGSTSLLDVEGALRRPSEASTRQAISLENQCFS